MSINPIMAVFTSWSTTKSNNRLWPAPADVPAGGRVVCGEADRAACLDYIEQNWPDIRPKSLRERLAAGRALDN